MVKRWNNFKFSGSMSLFVTVRGSHGLKIYIMGMFDNKIKVLYYKAYICYLFYLAMDLAQFENQLYEA